jgi:hypothetical protein
MNAAFGLRALFFAGFAAALQAFFGSQHFLALTILLLLKQLVPKKAVSAIADPLNGLL